MDAIDLRVKPFEPPQGWCDFYAVRECRRPEMTMIDIERGKHKATQDAQPFPLLIPTVGMAA